MVDAVVSFAIEKLDDFIAKQVNIGIGVKDGVWWLKGELAYLLIFVRAAEARQQDELICLWINSVKDIANQALLVLDRFSSLQEEQARPPKGILDWMQSYVCMCKKEAKYYNIGNDVESLKEKITVIKNRRIEYGINHILPVPNVHQKERTLLRANAINNQVDVVGLEDHIMALMAELDSEDPSLKVISIHGMGGLGKTSIATKLCNSGELRHFDKRAKVCVSNAYNIKDVLKRIIKSFMGVEHEKYMSEMDECDLLQHLKKLLWRVRYLALIDDIWDIEVWNQIKIAFPNQNNGSRIIITTRNKKIARMVGKTGFAHQLRFLSEDESWQLFCKEVEPTTQSLVKLGKEMVSKCLGLPLAIVVLSGLLWHNKSHDYWSKVKEHIWRHLKDDSVDIVEILSLSYEDLSSQMRYCFLYLARFPEDHIIHTESLKLLWIAEEFILDAEEGVVMEDLAEDCLNELINRNLIQVEHSQLNGQFFSCRVHDLVRELAINKAKEHKLLINFDPSKHHPDLFHLLEGQPRHVIHKGIGEYLKLLERGFNALYLRSLALYNISGKVKLKDMKLMCTRFKNLKVLDMRSVESDCIPEEIGDLVLLKFLGLMGGMSYSRVPIVIPPSIGKLKRLQILSGSKYKHYRVPREISELHELRYLKLKINGILNIGSHQTKLHTLYGIHYKEWIQIDTFKFTNLRALLIEEDDENEEGKGGYGYTLESMANLTSLQTFSLFFHSTIPPMRPLLSCIHLKSVDLKGEINDQSDLFFLPDSVTDLSLCFSEFAEDPMPTLGKLSNLTTLALFMAYMGNKMICSQNAFPSLQILRLTGLPNLEELQVENGALTSLKSFQTSDCRELKKISVQLEPLWIKRGEY